MIKKLGIILCLFAYVAMGKAQINDEIETQKNREYNYYYVEGLRSKLWAKTDEAFGYFGKCIQINPEADAAFYELALLYFQNGQNDKGMAMMKSAVENAPDNKWYKTFLANLYEQSKDNEKAAEIIKTLVEAYPDDVNYLMRLAAIYTKDNKYIEAIDVYNKMYPLLDNDENVKLEIQRLYLLNNQPKKAIEEIKALMKADDNNPHYYTLLGDVYLSLNDNKKALKYYKKAKKINPDFSGIPLSMANYYQQVGDKQSMIEAVKEVVKHPDVESQSKQQVFLQILMKASNDSIIDLMLPDLFNVYKNEYPKESEARILYGNYLVTEKQDTSGYQLFSEALDLAPENKDLYTQLLNFYIGVNNSAKVDWICTKGISYFPDEPLFYFYSAFVAFGDERPVEAKKLLLQGYSYAKKNVDLFVQYNSFLGDILHSEDNSDSAFVYYDIVLGLNPNHVPTLNNYAYYLSLLDKKLDKAEDMSARTVNLAPGNATYLDTYAWVLFKRNKLSLAKFYIERAMSNGAEDNLEVREHFADILAASNDKVEAIKEYQKLIKADYNVERNLQKIKELNQ